jgi:hypothetical protein
MLASDIVDWSTVCQALFGYREWAQQYGPSSVRMEFLRLPMEILLNGELEKITLSGRKDSK